jgi:NitT/TauT family transport system ATP-binding protein
MNKEIVIKAENIHHFFIGDDGRKIHALDNITFEVRAGEFFTILGPSGCGKSTLLRILAGIIPQSGGRVVFSDTEAQKSISMVFQSFALFPWLTVKENVEFGLKMLNLPAEEIKILAKEHIQEIGLEGFENLYPKDLSGGMKQRVGIARALAISPKILLMDEPFSSLDAFTAEKLRQEVLNLWIKDKMTVIMVTHLVDEAVEMSDKILVMTPRPGKVEAIVPVSLPRPRSKRSTEFFQLVDKVTEVVKV